MKYDGKNLNEVLKAHKLWLMNPSILNDSQYESISRADLSEADLSRAHLSRANLSKARLIRADLSGADLSRAHLSRANLIRANLSGADLSGADLYGADLYGVNLNGANLHGADLYKADLREAKNIPYIPMACPDTGSFIGWKACNTDSSKVIVKLLIPEDAKRSSGTGRKCRCDKAVVLEIQTMEGEPLDGIKAYSDYDESFIYEVGKIVTPTTPFCEERFKECSSGIHFFINRQEAVNYNI